MAESAERWNRAVADHKAAVTYWHETNAMVEALPRGQQSSRTVDQDHQKAVTALDAAEVAILEASPPTSAGVAYQFKVAAERYMEVEVDLSPLPHEEPVRAAIFRRVYATLLAIK